MWYPIFIFFCDVFFGTDYRQRNQTPATLKTILPPSNAQRRLYIPACKDTESEDKQCTLCCTNKVILVAIPCGCAKYCGKCAVSTKDKMQCYFCREPIINFNKIYF